VVIVKYRSEKYLPGCLASIKESRKGSELQSGRVEVIIVDNDEKNIGYGPACNKGAEKGRGEYLLFLNPDTIVLPGSLEKMVEYLDKHPKVGVLGPQLLDETGEIIPSSSAIPTPLMTIFSLTFLAKLFSNNHWSREYWYQDWDRKSEKEVGAVSGAALLIRKNLFEKLGGFDEKFFLYFEEVDLCKRVREAGFKIVFNPSIKVIHYGEKSTEKGEKVNRIFSESRFYFFRKHFGWLAAAMVHFFAVLFLASGWERLKIGKVKSLAWILAIIFVVFNLYRLLSSSFFVAKYGPPLSARIALAKFVVNDAHGQPFDLKREGPLWDLPNTNKNYEYLLWWLGNQPQKEAAQLSYTIYEPKEVAKEFKIKGSLYLFDYSAVEVRRND
jgi:GT2 family glycosyltransferase